MTAATRNGARATPSTKAPARPKKAAKATKPASKAAAKPKAKAPKADAQPARKRGGQSTFTQAAADRVCEGLAKGIPLTVICAEPGMPCDDTVRNWAEKDEAFGRAIVRAREQGFDRIAIDALEIADERSKDTILTDQGERPNTEWIARSKLRIETRLKLLAKWDPKRYGEKTTTEVTGANGGAIQHSIGLRFVDSEAGSKNAGSDPARFSEGEG